VTINERAPEMEWCNQVAVVTGGSHGSGRATPSRRADTDALRSIVCIFNEDVLRPVKASRRDHGNESSRSRV
jgi:NAD(P)-dependent dehydrogenase (short-subunit alcohol dehydrogenase family)